jgi:hypothetical protein
MANTAIRDGAIALVIGAICIVMGIAQVAQNTVLSIFGESANATLYSIELSHTRLGVPSDYKVRYTFSDKDGKLIDTLEIVDTNPMVWKIRQGAISTLPHENVLEVRYWPKYPSIQRLSENYDGTMPFALFGGGVILTSFGVWRIIRHRMQMGKKTNV